VKRRPARRSRRKIRSRPLRLNIFFLFFFLISVFCFQTSAFAACFNPAGNAGNVIYNGPYRMYQYCNGGAWIGIGKVSNLTGGLVGWWKLDETSGTSAADATGNGNTGTLTNGPTWTTGMNNGALTLVAASSQYVSVPDAASLQLAGSWTVSTWVKFSAFPGSGGEACMIQKDTPAGNNYSLCYGNNFFPSTTGIQLSFVGSFGSQYIAYPSVSLNTWYHAVGVWDSSSKNLYLYVNGALVATQSPASNSPSSTSGSALYMGSNQYTTALLNGTMDDARIYNRALSAADIKTLYTSTGGTSGDINSNLVGYWKLDENSGTTANDSIGGNTGTLVNSPTWTTSGKINGAAQFVTTSYINAGHAASLNDLATFTWSAWVYPNSWGSSVSYILAKISAGGSGKFLRVDNGSLLCEVTSSTTTAVAGGTLSLNQWQHVAMTFDSGTGVVTSYKNGIAIGSGTGTPNFHSDAPYDLAIGNNPNNTTRYFDGTIDDVRVYNRALSPADVLTLYNSDSSEEIVGELRLG
jgi:Concanavalin A-like lectin/glucanases superfamily